MSTGGISSMLDVARRSLSAQTQAIRVRGDNIANVNTEGYSRRRAVLQSDAGFGLMNNAVGTGAVVERIERIVDTFINNEALQATNERAYAEIRKDILERAEASFSVEGDTWQIGTRISSFFSALEDLAAEPTSIPLRNQVIHEGNLLCQSINTTFDSIATLQRESDQRIEALITEVNGYAEEVADLNGQIASTEYGDQEALTLRDQRDAVLEKMSELIGINTVEASNGAVLVYLDSGFAVVNGTNTYELEYTKSPTFAPVNGYPPGLDGQGLGFIVHDFGAAGTPSHVDLTDVLRNGGGEVGGLLSLRGVQHTTDTDTFHTDGTLVDLASRVEALARDLLKTFNRTYQGTADEDAGTPGWQSNSGDLDGNQPGFDGLFTFDGIIDDDSSGRLSQGDLDAYSLANGGFSSFAKVISFKITDPRAIAAALDLDPVDNSTSFASGDARNLDLLIALRSQSRAFNVPSTNQIFQTDSTMEDVYNVAVTYAGSLSHEAQNDYTIYADREKQVKEIKSTFSGVSLDEEFAQLIMFQRAFQASARVISIGEDLMSEIMAITG